MSASAWLWIPLVLAAAAAQTVRNAAQRNLIATAGTLPATFVRFFYGLPFVVAGYIAARALTPDAIPAPPAVFFGWVAVGALGQLAATALLLAAMARRSFIVAVAYSKTELVQIVVYSIVLLGESVSAATVAAIVLATLGVVLLSVKGASDRGATVQSWLSPAAFLGLGCGSGFALSAVGYRGAALTLGELPVWITGTYAVMWGQAMQSVVLGSYLVLRDRRGLREVVVQWRISALAGLMGALASIGWMMAFAMKSAADVRTVGLVEVLYGYALSRRVFREPVSGRELTGIILVAAGIVVISVTL
ncbi:MAG: DMT family transporter [Casimicrobiaceae bacterium]